MWPHGGRGAPLWQSPKVSLRRERHRRACGTRRDRVNVPRRTMAFVSPSPCTLSSRASPLRRARCAHRPARPPCSVRMARAHAQSDEAADVAEQLLSSDDLQLPSQQSAEGDPASDAAQQLFDSNCVAEFLESPSLNEYREQKEAGLITSALYSGSDTADEFSDVWALAVDHHKANELRNQYSRVGILIEHNFADFEPAQGCEDALRNATIEEIAFVKAKGVYEATGLPAIAEFHDMTIDAPKSSANINKAMQQGYHTRDVAGEANSMIERVRPISDENRMVNFNSAVSYFDGEIQIVAQRSVSIAIAFAGAHHVTIAIASALDELFMQLSRRLKLTFDSPGQFGSFTPGGDDENEAKQLVGARMLKERILREGKMLGDGIIKVSSFLNHMVDTELMEVCGEELAERLRHTMPNKILTVESTGLIAGLPTARRLGIPLVFARKSRPITISDSYQTTYRSATKGTSNELIVSCEYLESGDRVLIIDDFLAGGSTAEALFKLAKMAHAKVVGVGVLIEKMMDGGRAFLSGYDVPVESLAKLLPAGDKGRISFVEEEPWVGGAEAKRPRKRDGARDAVVGDEHGMRGASEADAAAEEDGDDEDDEDDDDDDDVAVIRWEDADADDDEPPLGGERLQTLDEVEERLTRGKT
ncbi:Phosphoribosyltransferase [Gracilaria domingensis]|nr:Phosphoribosyltransferase [Gracilaria domingensis]